MSILSGMDIERIGKYINKSSISLDEFVGVRVICRGFVGTKITLSSVTISYMFGGSIEVNITENSKLDNFYTYNSAPGVRYEMVYIPVDMYTTSARIQYEDYDLTLTRQATYAQTWVLSYNLDKVFFSSEAPGTYNLSIPEKVTALVVDAIGGGGGGQHGPAKIDTLSGAGGYGGGAASYVRDLVKPITSPTNLSVVVGAGGKGAEVANRFPGQVTAAKSGNPVIFSGAFSLTVTQGFTPSIEGQGGSGVSGIENGRDGKAGKTSTGVVGGLRGIGGSKSASSGGGGGGGGDGSVFGIGGNGGTGGKGNYGKIPEYYGGKGLNGTKGAGGGGGGGCSGALPTGALGGDGGDGGGGWVQIRTRISV